MRPAHPPAALLPLLAVLSFAALTACGPADSLDPPDPPDDEGLPASATTEPDAEIGDQVEIDDPIDIDADDDAPIEGQEDEDEEPAPDDALDDVPTDDTDVEPDDADPEADDADVEADDADVDGPKDDGPVADAASFPGRTFLLPFTCGKRVLTTQGNNTGFSHQDTSRWAYDFKVKTGTRVRAMKRGRVTHVRRATEPGDACYQGGGPECRTQANYVVVKHRDGSSTMYAHLSRVRVHVGDRVARGAVLGRSGNTGYSTGPHLHVARQEACGSSHCQSIRLKFGDVGGDHMPNSGQWVRSKNGCD